MGWIRSDSAAFSGSWAMRSENVDQNEFASIVWPLLVSDTNLDLYHFRNASLQNLIWIYVDDVEVIYNSGFSQSWALLAPKVFLSAGYHEISFDFDKITAGSRAYDYARNDAFEIAPVAP